METVIALLQRYSFDLGTYTINDLIRAWSSYDTDWVRMAILESLYQGRYKAVSVSQILGIWRRRGEPCHRFTREFERLVCSELPAPVPYRPLATSEPLPPPIDRLPPLVRSPAATAPPKPSFTFQRETYRPALENMELLAQPSKLIDKLRALCQRS
ncbi:MAG: hypothetical protein HC919_07735 [Oscillatoriales cyanobacterium SM2_2_1]|nr:hypothetical protein [Oscillatoriales cyanobacterium SM2_2_1]